MEVVFKEVQTAWTPCSLIQPKLVNPQSYRGFSSIEIPMAAKMELFSVGWHDFNEFETKDDF